MLPLFELSVVISRVRDGRLDEEYTAAVRGVCNISFCCFIA